MPMDLYHTSCCFLPLGDMVFQSTGCLCLLSIVRACGVSPGLTQLLLVGTITRGIFIGCTASIMLLLSAINIIKEHISAVREGEIYNTMTSTPIKAFMDDMFLMSPSIPTT